MKKINQSKIRFFEKINEAEKPLAKMIKMKKKDSNNWNQKWKQDITTIVIEIKEAIREHYEKLYANRQIPRKA